MLTVFTFACFLLLTVFFWEDGRELLKILLIPGDSDTTIQAVQVFAQEVGSGFQLKSAVRNLFSSILSNGYSG